MKMSGGTISGMKKMGRGELRRGSDLGARVSSPNMSGDAHGAERGFTMIELLVVMSVIVILVSVAVPVLSKLSQSNKLTQARNMASAYIANARSAAIQAKRPVAAIFYEPSINPVTGLPNYADTADPNQSVVMLAVASADQSGAGPGNILFVAMPGRSPVALPAGIKVATLDDSSVFKQSESFDSTKNTRAIVFDANGQLLLRGGLKANASGAAGSSTRIVGDWSFGGGVNAVSSPGIVIYDGQKFRDAGMTSPSTSDAARSSWLQTNADILVVNVFTGNLNK
jgi:prepilin-type N-terminal cleavage/methylation domain-containing protein